MIDHAPRRLSAVLVTALALLSAPAVCLATTTVAKDGTTVVLQNALVKVEYDLSTGTYSAYSRTDQTANLTGACLRIDEFSSAAAGLTRTWESVKIKDELGSGRKLVVHAAGPGKPELRLEIVLYNDRSFLALCGGLKNTLGQSIMVKEIEPTYRAKAFVGVSPKADLRMLNGPGGAGIGLRMDGVKQEVGLQTRVHSVTNMESPNNLLATFVSAGQRKSIVVGGLTYHDYAKVASAARIGNDELTASIMNWDATGKRVDSGVSYTPDDRCYVDFCTANQFAALEQYGLAVRAAQKVKLMINDFPTVDGWYVAVFSGGGSEPNNTAGMVAQMDAVVKSGFLRYSKVGIRLIPDDYGPNNEQGWWDDEHWQKYGHYVKPYETTRKWAQAIIERGGIPLIYSQTTSYSRDFMAAHSDWYTFNDTKRLVKADGSLDYGKGALDFTDPDLKEHLRKVYGNMRDGGLAGLMFD